MIHCQVEGLAWGRREVPGHPSFGPARSPIKSSAKRYLVLPKQVDKLLISMKLKIKALLQITNLGTEASDLLEEIANILPGVSQAI